MIGAVEDLRLSEFAPDQEMAEAATERETSPDQLRAIREDARVEKEVERLRELDAKRRADWLAHNEPLPERTDTWTIPREVRIPGYPTCTTIDITPEWEPPELRGLGE